MTQTVSQVQGAVQALTQSSDTLFFITRCNHGVFNARRIRFSGSRNRS